MMLTIGYAVPLSGSFFWILRDGFSVAFTFTLQPYLSPTHSV
jgi:hypothetical protein